MNDLEGVTDRDKLSGLFRFAQGVLAAKERVLMRMQDTGWRRSQARSAVSGVELEKAPSAGEKRSVLPRYKLLLPRRFGSCPNTRSPNNSRRSSRISTS